MWPKLCRLKYFVILDNKKEPCVVNGTTRDNGKIVCAMFGHHAQKVGIFFSNPSTAIITA